MTDRFTRIALIGARLDGQAGVVLDILEQQNRLKVVAFLDSSPELLGKKLHGIPVIGNAKNIDSLDIENIDVFHLAIGDNKARSEIYHEFKNRNLLFQSVIHPSSVISKTADIGEGCFIGANAVIQNNVKISNVTFINTGAIIEHDNIIGEAVHVAPNVCTAGRVTIHDLAFIGIGSTIIPDIEIGRSAFIAAGSVIVKNVPSETTMIGYAAKVHKKNIYVEIEK